MPAVLAALLVPPDVAGARDPARDAPLPVEYTRLIACKELTDAAARLACYDRETSALAQAHARREVVLIDRQGMRRARNSLFGLSIPNFDLFKNDEGEAVSRIEAKITSVSQTREGRWSLSLDNGSRWLQVDGRPRNRDPRPGQTIAIRRAALGSFLANIDGQIAIRVRRVI